MTDFQVGRRLGPYELEEQIGQGGMGVVFRAIQPSVHRTVAVKVIGQPYAQDPAFLSGFETEVRAAQLQHPHILPVYDVGVDDGHPYLVMAYVGGGTLADAIAAAPRGLPLEDVARITLQIGAALDQAHAAGVLHRDLKPGNVLLDEQGNAYLSDFGVAQVAGEVGIEWLDAPGTRPYMAPEVLGGEPASTASDLYALGVITYEMLTGHRPRTQPNRPPDRRVGSPPPALDALPPGMRMAVMQALHPDPDARPPSASAFAQTLGRACERLAPPIPAPPIPDLDDILFEDLPLFGELATPPPSVSPGAAPTSPSIRTTATVSPLPTAARPARRTVSHPPHDDLPTRILIGAVSVALFVQFVVLFVVVMISLGNGPH